MNLETLRKARVFFKDTSLSFYDIGDARIPSLFSTKEYRDKYLDVEILWSMLYLSWRKGFSLNRRYYVSPFSKKVGKTSWRYGDNLFKSLEYPEGVESLLKAISALPQTASEPLFIPNDLPEYVNSNIFVKETEGSMIDFYDSDIESSPSLVGKLGFHLNKPDTGVYSLVYSRGYYYLGKIEFHGTVMSIGPNRFSFDPIYEQESYQFLMTAICNVALAQGVDSIRFINYVKQGIKLADPLTYDLGIRPREFAPVDVLRVSLELYDKVVEIPLPFNLEKVNTYFANLVNSMFAIALKDRIKKYPKSIKLVGDELRFLTTSPTNFKLVGIEPLYVDRETRLALGEECKYLPYLSKLYYLLTQEEEMLRTNLGAGLYSLDGKIRGNLFARY